jgi:hypothetical protein
MHGLTISVGILVALLISGCGKMPAFEDELSRDDQKAAIAYFQSKWEMRIYEAWSERSGL